MMPALQQVCGIEFLLLAPRLFELIDAALSLSQGFQHLAFAESPLIGLNGLLTECVEAANFFLKLNAKLPVLVAEEAGELEVGSSTSSGQAAQVGEGGVDQKAFEPRECFLGARQLQRSVL